MSNALKTVIVIYYDEDSLTLENAVGTFLCHQDGRVVLPDSFKRNKSIVAVCEGKINILNSLGDRVKVLDEEVFTNATACY